MDYQQFKKYVDSGDYSLVNDEYLKELEAFKRRHQLRKNGAVNMTIVGLMLLAFILRLLGII